MSWECTAYVSGLSKCPDGAEISAAQKLLLFVLSNYHNTQEQAAWPELPRLARESLNSLTSVKRFLDYFEQHCMLERRDRTRKGRGAKNNYVFLGLDDPKRLAQKLKEQQMGKKETVQIEPFFCPDENGSDSAQKQPLNGSETVQKNDRNSPETVQIDNAIRNYPYPTEPEPKPNPDQHAIRAALKTWLTIKQKLQPVTGDAEWLLWVRPAYLLALLSGTQLLVALPANGPIIEAAQARLPYVVRLAREYGYSGVSLTRYPDDWEREQVRERYPEFYEQRMLGNGAA